MHSGSNTTSWAFVVMTCLVPCASPVSAKTNDTIGADEEESLHIRSTSVFLRMKSSSWLKEPKFYLVGAIYICVRLVTNISLVYMSLYLNDDLMLNKVHVALVPLSIYAISLVTSIIQKKMNKWMGRKITLCTGFIIILGYSASIYFVTRPASLIHLYGTVLLLGIGTSIVMVGSLSLTADMIGNEVKTSAFVYGAMSLGDKFFNGMAVEVIQLIHPCTNCSVKFMWFYRSIEVFFIGIIGLIGLVLVFLLSFVNVSDLRFYKNPANVTSVNGRVRNYGTVSDQCDSSEEVVYR